MIQTSKAALHQLVDALPPEELPAAARFLEFLRDRGSSLDLADLRTRLEPFAEEWDSPEMDAYDHYDTARG
jgi:hypothetical protein